MVIDTSTARAILKRQCKLMNRRYDNIKVLPAKKSRKGWLKEVISEIKQYNIILSDCEHKKNERMIITLTSCSDESGFYTSCYTIDLKKCHVDNKIMSIEFSTHFLIRALQSFKTTDLSSLKGMFLKIMESVFTCKIDLEKNSHYDLYAKGVGMLPLLVEDHNIIIKTLVPLNMLGSQQKINYEKSPLLLDTTNK